MSTESQINANRLNARKSTGPKTPEGKEKVSQNAVTHGLTSKRPVLDIEDTEEFRQFSTELLDCLAPADPLEFFFAQRATCLAWRVQRAQSYETLILNNLIKDVRDKTNPNDQMGSTAKRSLTVELENGQDNTDSILGQVITDDFRNHRTLEKISRYEARLENSMLRCFKQFENLRQNRKTTTINAGQAFPLDFKFDKTNPISVGQASVLHSKSALTPKESSSNGNQNNEINETNPIDPQIMTQKSLNLLKIPA